jgi:hypothetical protein
MALDSLKKFKGSTVLLVGEHIGDTGTTGFNTLLESDYVLVERVALPNFGNTSYDLTVWRKRDAVEETGTLPRPSMSCTICSGVNVPLHRCRFTCALQFCSEACMTAGRDLHTAELEKRHLLLDQSTLEFNNPKHFRVLGEKLKKRKRKRDSDGKKIPN